MIDLMPFYQAKTFSSPNCWETCGGGHCCKFYNYFKNLKFGDKKSQVLYLFDFEVEWLKQNQKLPEVFEKTLRCYSYDIENFKVTYYTVNCGSDGRCPDHQFRPLTCFIYPYFPYFDKNGTIEKFCNLSIYDDFYEHLKLKKPCTLYDKFSAGMYQNTIDTYLRFKQFYFYCNLYFRFKEIIIQNFLKVSSTNTFVDMLPEFEILMAMRKLISKEQAIQIVKEEKIKFNM